MPHLGHVRRRAQTAHLVHQCGNVVERLYAIAAQLRGWNGTNNTSVRCAGMSLTCEKDNEKQRLDAKAQAQEEF